MKEQGLLYGPLRRAAAELALRRHRAEALERRRLHDPGRRATSRRGAWRRSCSSTTASASTAPPRSVAGAARLGEARIPGRLTHPSVRNFLGVDVPQAGALRARAGSVGAAAPGDRRELRGGHRAAVGVVRRAAPDAVARRRAVPRERPGAAAAHERRRDRHDDLVQPVRGRGVGRRRACCPTRVRTFVLAQRHDRQHELRRDPVQRGERRRARWSSPNFLLEPATQAHAQDIRQMGNFTVLDLAKLSPADRKRFDDAAAPAGAADQRRARHDAARAASVVDDAHHRRVGEPLHANDSRAVACCAAPRRRSPSRRSSLPIAAGLAGTLAARVRLPARDRRARARRSIRGASSSPGPGFATSVRADARHRRRGDAAVSALLAFGFCAWAHGTRVVRRARAAWLAPMLATPHSALAIGLAFLIAPSGWIVRALSPWLTGWTLPPDVATVGDPRGRRAGARPGGQGSAVPRADDRRRARRRCAPTRALAHRALARLRPRRGLAARSCCRRSIRRSGCRSTRCSRSRCRSSTSR